MVTKLDRLSFPLKSNPRSIPFPCPQRLWELFLFSRPSVFCSLVNFSIRIFLILLGFFLPPFHLVVTKFSPVSGSAYLLCILAFRGLVGWLLVPVLILRFRLCNRCCNLHTDVGNPRFERILRCVAPQA
ncbi:hypothetical protein JB92DRAFT_2908976 [Gautieria morchelliformis]|nr:hypothetical protein JB92DRAFT_2908976 [Gautieria morchelliformis]